VAALILLYFALGLDQGGFARLANASSLGWGLLVVGTVTTALFQVECLFSIPLLFFFFFFSWLQQGLLVGVQSVVLSTSAGVLSIAVVVPQIAISLAISPQSLETVQIVGYVLAVVGAFAYTVVRNVELKRL
jgi:hypothetical protein